MQIKMQLINAWLTDLEASSFRICPAKHQTSHGKPKRSINDQHKNHFITWTKIGSDSSTNHKHTYE